MFRGLDSLLVGSFDAKKLAKFYQEKVGLTLSFEAELGDKPDNLYVFEFENGTTLNIMDHSKVISKNKNPEQIIFNLEVDDIEGEFAKLIKNGITKIADIYHVENYGHVATFEDLDGNYFQIVQVKAS